MTMSALVACEESQRVTIELRKLGVEAYSCDIQDCSGGHPEWHIKDDVVPLLNPSSHWSFALEDSDIWCGIDFATVDGAYHRIEGAWDLIIAHPPCTRLCNSGQRWLYYGDEQYRKRKQLEQQEAISFFYAFVVASCEHIAIENPVGIMSTRYRKPDCTYNPYDFEGETERKKTCLWLKGLPPLKPTQTIPKDQRTDGIWRGHFEGKCYGWNDPMCAKLRSRTPFGVARAMAEQWVDYIRKQQEV